MDRFFHGTDWDSANEILAHGLDRTIATRFNGGGEFWVTTRSADADYFAQANPASGVPARFEFHLPVAVLAALLSAKPPLAIDHAHGVYEFLPLAFDILNREMRN